ncbi:hypothetical protein KQI42_00065 [Tissierella sp. MSJ-40]|uniref:Uncharacterized protein n=1 Tax=Tissierella simiarum TaxID=2841534 RepID=A0ABS6E0F0_9FIRM|nr:hypothetical protein [Tissierella simiarum]MBU5436382.1 hypothetical protein [Tissierella simiarum]
MADKKVSIRLIDDLSKNIDSMEIARRKFEILVERYERQAKNVEALAKRYEKVSSKKRAKEIDIKKARNDLISAQEKEIALAEELANTKKALEVKEEKRNGFGANDDFSKRMKNIFGKFINVDNVKKGFQQTIGAAAKLNEQSVSMQAAFGDVDMGKSYFNNLKAYAIETGHDLESLIGITKKFTGITKNANSLMGLTDTASKLSLKTGDLGSAGDLIQEAMEGRYDNLQNVLNLDDSQMEPLKQAIKKGSMDGIIDAFGETLNTAGLTDEIMEAYKNSPITKYEKIMNGFKTKLAETGEGALERLVPILEKVEEWLQSSNAVQFFDNISHGIAWITEKAIELFSFISDNWGIIEPMLFGIVAAVLAWEMATSILAIKQEILNSILLKNPWTWIIMGIVTLIAFVYKLWQTNDEFALAIMRTWYNIMDFLSDVYLFFLKLKNGMVNIVADAKIKIIQDIEDLINKAIKNINSFIEKLNKISIISIDLIESADFAAHAALEVEAERQSKNDSIAAKEIDIAIQKSRRQEKLLDFEKRRASSQEPIIKAINDSTEQQSVFNVKQQDNLAAINNNGVGIKDSIDKSNEELQWMKDFAEQEAINKFTSATLAPQISVQFGDVRETADVDGIVDHIERVLTEQINIAAEGVYS